VGPKPLKSPSGISLDAENLSHIEEYLNRTGETLSRWLQDHAGVSSPSGSFPEVFLAGNTKVLTDLIQSISGRKIPLTGTSALRGSLYCHTVVML
jgi:hypothetical protein